MKTYITPASYYPPTDNMINLAAQAARLPKNRLDADFIRDTCSHMLGARAKSTQELRTDIVQDIYKHPSDYYKTTWSTDSTLFCAKDGSMSATSLPKLFPQLVQQKLNAQLNTQAFIAGLDNISIPGDTPLQKAVHVLRILEGMSDNSGGSPQDQLKTPEDVADALQELKERVETAENLTDFERDVLNEAYEDTNFGSTANGPGKGYTNEKAPEGHNTALKKVNVAKIANESLREVINLSRHINTFSQLRVHKERKFCPDITGDSIRSRIMDHMGELMRIRSHNWSEYVANKAFFTYKAVTRQFDVRERGIHTDKKQILYLLIDSSGSMHGERIYQAAGVLLNRLLAVASGDAILYWRFFDSQLHQEHYVDTYDTAKTHIRSVLEGSYSGGGTCFDRAIRGAVASITKHLEKDSENFVRPEIVIVTDGEDSCSVTNDELKDIKLHVLHCKVSRMNKELIKLAVGSGGIAHNLS